MNQPDTSLEAELFAKKCVTCQTILHGDYCHKCGEKKVSEKDFSFNSLVSQALYGFTHLDSKFFKSFKTLLFRPGFLSLAFVKGNRTPFMKPFQIFLICNILFFVFLSNTDVFRKPSSWWFKTEKDLGYPVAQVVKEKCNSQNITESDLSEKYEHNSAALSKSLVIIFLPFIALVLSLLQYKKKMPFGKHVIFTIHLFSFYLLIMVLWNTIVGWLPLRIFWATWALPIAFVFTLYFVVAFKEFYQQSWGNSIIKTLFCTLCLYLGEIIYRAIVSIIALHYT